MFGRLTRETIIRQAVSVVWYWVKACRHVADVVLVLRVPLDTVLGRYLSWRDSGQAGTSVQAVKLPIEIGKLADCLLHFS